MISVEELLQQLVERGGSDLHITAGAPPKIRIDGKLISTEHPVLDPETTQKLIYSILDNTQIARFEKDLELDMSFGIGGLGRFRTNVFMQRGAVGSVLRVIPYEIKGFRDLGLPEELCAGISSFPKGLVLVTGATGSGKTTTLSAVVDYINRTRAQHIVTIEDPIEFLHEDKRSIVNQREIGVDTESFGQALRRVLRQDPDVILVGELRDTETAHVALQAAESGHLVLSTLHTIDAAETLSRLIEFFPPEKQPQIVSVLAGSLRGVVSQRLLPRVGGGRVPAVEVMVVNARIAELIRDRRGDVIPQAIEDGEYFSMQSFTQALIKLAIAGLVEREVAANAATNRHDFLIALERAEKLAHVKSENARAEATEAQQNQPADAAPTLRLAGA